jgi:protease-4
MILACALLFLPGCVIIPISFSDPEYREIELRPAKKWFASKVLLVDLDGALNSMGSDGLFGTPNRLADLDEQLTLAEKDHAIKAVVLRINSPGGSVTASDLMHRRVQKYRDKTGVPVYVAMMDVAASGGYYVAMAGNKVYASPTSITGSIGVIAIFPEGQDLLNKIGIQVLVVKSGTLKDSGSIFRHMNSEEQEVFQKIVADLYERFLEVVNKGRPNLTPARVRELADGRVYTARQALEAGLVDGVAYLEEVIDRAEEAGGVSGSRVVTYSRSRGRARSMYATAPPLPETSAGWLDAAQPPRSSSTQINLLNVETGKLAARQPVFQYLWIP